MANGRRSTSTSTCTLYLAKKQAKARRIRRLENTGTVTVRARATRHRKCPSGMLSSRLWCSSMATIQSMATSISLTHTRLHTRCRHIPAQQSSRGASAVAIHGFGCGDVGRIARERWVELGTWEVDTLLASFSLSVLSFLMTMCEARHCDSRRSSARSRLLAVLLIVTRIFLSGDVREMEFSYRVDL